MKIMRCFLVQVPKIIATGAHLSQLFKAITVLDQIVQTHCISFTLFCNILPVKKNSDEQCRRFNKHSQKKVHIFITQQSSKHAPHFISNGGISLKQTREKMHDF